MFNAMAFKTKSMRRTKRTHDPTKELKEKLAAYRQEITDLKEELALAKQPRRKRGRVSKFEGARIFANVTENPRRETETRPSGYRSMEIILQAGKRGITYEHFIDRGGRSVDLAWDLAHGNITLS